jgi:enoyl-CoA hydratase/carnithine racemase
MKLYDTILTETIGDHLLKVTLNRPEVGNAKNTRMGLDLLDMWTGLIDDPGDVRCVILTGDRICEPDQLMPAVLETAQAICDNAPLSMRQAKKSIHNGLQMDLKRGFMFEIEAYNRLVDTEDRREGVLAFNEKRKPRFKGQ